MAERLRRDPLPPQWSYGVKADGRIFFINEETRTTTWLHPVTGKAIASGYHDRDDLPPGWQEGITREGATYFMNHNTGDTTFNNPITKQPEADDEFFLIDRNHETPPYHRPKLATLQMPQNNSFTPAPQNTSQYPSPQGPSPASPTTPNYPTTPTSPTTPSSSADRPSFRKKTVPKSSTPSLKRPRNSVASMEGWLFKQDVGPLKAWRKRWCVLADFCLFYYKGSDKTRSESGSILIPSYRIGPVSPQDKIAKKFAFKCEHENMRTYYFAAENQVDMNQWMRALNLAANAQMDGHRQSRPYDEDDAGFRDYHSRPKSGGAERDDDDWLFKSPKELNGTLPEGYDDSRERAPPQRESNGFDPDGRLPREPDEPESRYQNGDEDYNDSAPEGYWEARERYARDHGRYPEDNREGREAEHVHPPAIYDYPPDEDIDGYSSPEEGKRELRERYPEDGPGSQSDSERGEQPRQLVQEKEMSDREEYGMDQVRRLRKPDDDYDDRKGYRRDENGELIHPIRDDYDSQNRRSYPQHRDSHSRPDTDPTDGYTQLRIPLHPDSRAQRIEDQQQDGYNSLSESDQHREIVPVEERLVSSAAPVQEAGYDHQERPRSGHQRQASRLASTEDDRGSGRARDSMSSQASHDKHDGRHGEKHHGDHRRSWDPESGSLSSRDGGQRRSRSLGRERRDGQPPHSPGQYPESYNTLPRPRSKSRERRDRDDAHFSNGNGDESRDRRHMPHYDSSTTDSLPSPSAEATSSLPRGVGWRSRHEDPKRSYSLDHRQQRPHHDSDSQSDSLRGPSTGRSSMPQNYQDREGRRRDPRDMQGTRSLDRNQRPPHQSPYDSLPRAPNQSATLPHDYRSPEARRQDYAEQRPLAHDQPDSDMSKLSTPTGSAPGSVDGRASLPRDHRGPRGGTPRQEEEMRRDSQTGSLRRGDSRGDPRGDPRRGDPRGDPRSDPRYNRRSDPRGDPRRRDPRDDPRSDPRRGGPRDDPRGDPRRDSRGEPRRGDPRMDDSRRGDPRRGDSRGDPRGDPRHDSRRSDPRGDVRRGDPRRDQRRSDPRADPRGDRRRSDPQRVEPGRGRPREDGRREMEATQGRRPPESLHFQFPRNGEMRPDEVTPEQRSFLQSPLAQPGQEPLTAEQRADINSPMAYARNEPEWPTSRPEAYYKAKERQRESDRGTSAQHGMERQPQLDTIPQPVEAVIQRSTPTNMTFASAPPLSSSHGRYPEEQRPSNYDRPRRFASPIREEEVGTTETDIAPKRPINGGPRRRSDRTTLERNELDSGDRLAPLSQGGGFNREPRETSSRFKKWQIKAQPYILLSTGIRLRLSIAAGDLLGKSHEELVLLLIQLRRDQSNLERWLDMIDQEMALLTDPLSPTSGTSPIRARHGDSLHRRSNPNLSEEREFYEELALEREEVDRELEISRPLVHLVDNLVRMGSLYGGQNQMIAQEFYRDKVQKDLNYIQPKKLIEFSRRLEEEKLNRDLKGELQQIQTAEDRLLEIIYIIQHKEKLDQLHRLDRKLQEMSAQVSLLKEDKDKIETSLDRLGRQMDKHWDDREAIAGMEDQQRRLERELVKVRTQLAMGTKELEEVAAENGKIEYEVTLLRSKLDGRHHRSVKSPHEGASTKERLQMENEVTRVQSLMDSLDKQRNQLVNQMQTLRTGPTEAYPEKIPRHRHEHSPRTPKQYTVTDLDTMVSHDIDASSVSTITASDNGSKSAPPLRRRGDSFNRVKQIKEQQVQQSPVVETAHSTATQSSYHASPQILHPQPRYQQPPQRQMEAPQISPSQESQYYAGPPINHQRGESTPRDRGWYGDDSRADKRHTIAGYGRRPEGTKPNSKYHTISRTGEVVPSSPMRRTRSVPDHEGLMADGNERKPSAMDRLLPGSPYKNTTYDPSQGTVSDTEADPAAVRAKKKSLRATDGSQPISRSPALRHLRSARSQTLPGRFTNEPHTPPVFDPRPTPDLTNSGNDDATNGGQQQQQSPNRRHTFSGHPLLQGPQIRPFQKVQDDIAILELQKALKDPDDEENEISIPELSGPRPSEIVRGEYRPIEVDESTGGGLSYAHLAFIPQTYFQAKRKLLREWFFAATEPTQSKLGKPAKIVIPERYLPEEDEDETTMSPEEKERQEERVDRITKMLSAHSLQEWNPTEISLSTWDQAQGYPELDELRQKVEEEKQARQEVLVMRRALAQEVKEQSKVMAARSMGRNSGAQAVAER